MSTTDRAGQPFEDVGFYFKELERHLQGTLATDLEGCRLSLEVAFERTRALAHRAHDAGNKLIFVGNGGSAGIASHLAIDYSKNGGLRSLAFNDAAALTCLSNDLGYEKVFAKQVEFHARPGDVLMAISSSGRSPNILHAVESARGVGCAVISYSGFDDQNELRSRGDINYYVGSSSYGIVEIAHLALCHALLDFDMGWNGK